MSYCPQCAELLAENERLKAVLKPFAALPLDELGNTLIADGITKEKVLEARLALLAAEAGDQPGEPASEEGMSAYSLEIEGLVRRKQELEAEIEQLQNTDKINLIVIQDQQVEIERLHAAQALVSEQANDELWFVAETCAEAYLQQALRRLHAVIEGKSPEKNER